MEAHEPGIHDNCINLNERPHGIGTGRAVNKTTGSRVTTFYRNNDAYWATEHHNGTLDRDSDRIACQIRESARMQSFPDDYDLTGSRSPVMWTIGNVIAVNVARAIGTQLRAHTGI